MSIDQIFDMLSNPVTQNVLVFVLGWFGLPQPALISLWWTRIMGVAHALAKSESYLMRVDAMLKDKGLIPRDAPTLTVDKLTELVNTPPAAKK